MKIKTYQSGGIVYLPTVNRNEGAATYGTASSSSSSGESKVPGFAHEMISLIKENGLNSDVSVFLNQLDRMLVRANDPTGENLSMREILQAQKLANSVKQNYASYKTAESSLESQDAWSEPATSARGWLYIIDPETKKVINVSPTEYDPQKHGYALTNQDLMNLRREYPELAFDSSILDNIAQSVGMKTITDYVANAIKDFGKTTITGYSEKQAGIIRMGMDQIVSGDAGDIDNLIIKGPDGLFKLSQESTVADTHIKEALDYLKNTLPNSYINTLNAKAAAEGYQPDALLLQMLWANTSRKAEAVYDHTASEDAGVGPAGKAAATKLDDHDTYLMRIATGGIPEITMIMQNPDKPMDTAAMYAVASKVGPLIDKDNKSLQIGNLNTIIEKLEAAKAANSKDITFGDQLLNLGERGAVIWDGESELTDIWLPYKNEGGQIKPDFSKLERLNEFTEALRDNPNISTLEKMNLMRAKGLNPQELVYDSETNTWTFRESSMKLFLSFSGIASSNNIDFTEGTEKMIQRLDSDESKHMVQLYNNAVKYNTISRSKSTRAVNTSFRKGKDANWFREGNLYRGTVYMPIDNEYLAMHMSTNQNIPKSELTRFSARVQATEALNNMKNPDIATLGQFK